MTGNRDVHGTDTKHQGSSNLLRRRHLQSDDHGNRNGKENYIGNDIGDGDGNVQTRQVDTGTRSKGVRVKGGANRSASKEEEAGDDDGVAGHHHDGGPDGDSEPSLGRDLEVKRQEGRLAEAVAGDEDGRDDV